MAKVTDSNDNIEYGDSDENLKSDEQQSSGDDDMTADDTFSVPDLSEVTARQVYPQPKQTPVFKTNSKSASMLPKLNESDEESMTQSTATLSSIRSESRRKADKHLTVRTKTRVECELEKRENRKIIPRRFVAILKWLMTMFSFLLLLCCMTASKISVISIAEKLNMTSVGPDTESERITSLRSFLMLLLLLIIPNAIGFLRAMWTCAGRKDIPWPKRSSILWGLLVSALESLGLCIFAFKILSMTRAAVGILLMNTVYLVPVVVNMIRGCRNIRGDSRVKKWTILFVMALCFEAVGLGLTVYMFAAKYKDLYSFDVTNVWHIPVAIFSLSISWIPGIQKKLTESKSDPAEEPEKKNDNSFAETQSTIGASSGYNSTETSGAVNGNGEEYETTHKTLPRILPRKPSAIWKHTILLSLWKIIFIFIFGILLNFFDHSFYHSFSDFSKDFKLAWDWSYDDIDHQPTAFTINALASIVGYIAAYLACSTCMQAGGFALPLFLATPIAMILVTIRESCSFIFFKDDSTCLTNYSDLALLIPAAICLLIAQGLSIGWFVFRSGTIVLQKETKVFWIPSYNGILLEQWLFLNLRNQQTDEYLEDAREKARRTRVYICTTMYRENAEEMKQILESINRVNVAQSEGDRHFESHVFFDGGVKDTNPSAFALQLVALVEPTLGVKADECTKVKTPYGMKLSWNLPFDRHGRSMSFTIHLKDNLKVKNKKRWSQIMYMSYVLDFLMEHTDYATDEETFILTTDADVLFTPDSVEALLDLMTRDRTVGAVCARTHPQGSGALVWYQIFEYAIGHWFQKAAEHVLGSVLCAPGCFSVYRCKAVRDVVSTYASTVDAAFDFLIKDMGEDRWLCTLMIQSGWRIEYCAASECKTHCPEEFDEFYKQRRRWIASTIANLMMVIREWYKISIFNHQVSVFFLVYQAVLLFSTLIGPSTVILIVAGGLTYAWQVNSTVGIVMQIVVCVGFAFLCLLANGETQLKVAKLLTFMYAIVMTAVVVGTAVQIEKDINKGDQTGTTTTKAPPTFPPVTTQHPQLLESISSEIPFGLGASGISSDDLPVSVTTIYLASLSAMFIIAGLAHPLEILCLLHGIWYLLCLPSGYLVLNIYSICNITDRSWGTREEKEVSLVRKDPWYIQLKGILETIFFCCKKKEDDESQDSISADPRKRHPSEAVIHEEGEIGDYADVMTFRRTNSMKGSRKTLGHRSAEVVFDENIPSGDDDDDDVDPFPIDRVVSVEEWIPKGFKEKYVQKFKDHGFGDTRMISGMNERELKDIGVKSKGHLQFLSEQIKLLPEYEVDTEVPNNANEWLEKVGLGMYKSNFRRNHIISSKDMEVLKSMNRKEIEKELGIHKAGHVKRLMYAISRLRNPTASERNIIEMRRAVESAYLHKLKQSNVEEFYFWDSLKKECLLPSSKAFGLDEELKVKLGELRNTWLMIFAVTNTLWLTLIATLAAQGNLTVLGANPLGLVFLFIFGIIFIIQFLAMFVHRTITLTHFLARAPYTFGKNYNSSWSFSDADLRKGGVEDSSDFEALLRVKEAERHSRQRIHNRVRGRSNDSERAPLIQPSQPNQNSSLFV